MKAVPERIQSAFTENGVLKILAFVLALTMVLVKSEDKVSDLEFDIPLTLEYPENRTHHAASRQGSSHCARQLCKTKEI